MGETSYGKCRNLLVNWEVTPSLFLLLSGDLVW